MSRRNADAARHDSWAPLIAVCAFLVVAAVVWLAWLLGALISPPPPGTPHGPVAVLVGVVFGKVPWSTSATAVLVVLLVLIAAGGGWLLWMRRAGAPRRGVRRHEPIDSKARYMATPRELNGVTTRDAKRKAVTLWPACDDRDRNQWGIFVATTVLGNAAVYLSWEDVAVIIAGQRAGKTAGLAIGATVGAPGCTLVTANKRDLLDATRGARNQRGRVWINDLQMVARPVAGVDDSRERNWWWNPLRGITTISEAKKIAENFISASKPENSTVDSYFDGGAGDVLSLMMLAAALADGDMLHVYGWLNQPNRTLPEELLRQHDDELNAVRLESLRKLNPRQRDGLYDMARRFIGVLANNVYAQSVTPHRRRTLEMQGSPDSDMAAIAGLGDPREEFIVEDFVASSDTLYLLSEDDAGSAAPLTTALAGKVFEAASALAGRSYRGRMPTPMVAVLDEAANVCKLAHLPAWYSHFGSRGIVLLTFLQSKEQGGRVWGTSGINTMVDTANLHYYGGSVRNTDYLSDLSKHTGDRDVSRWSRSTNSGDSSWLGGHSRSESWNSEPILKVDDLASMPETRALAHFSKNTPVLVRKAFWNDGPYREVIEGSIATYSPEVGGSSRIDAAGGSASAPLPSTPAAVSPLPNTPRRRPRPASERGVDTDRQVG